MQQNRDNVKRSINVKSKDLPIASKIPVKKSIVEGRHKKVKPNEKVSLNNDLPLKSSVPEAVHM